MGIKLRNIIGENTYRNDVSVMLDGSEEEGAVDEWVAVENRKRVVAQHAVNVRSLVRSHCRQDEASRLIVAMVTIILHL